MTEDPTRAATKQPGAGWLGEAFLCLGVATALHLLYLKVANASCASDCGAVIHSRFGTFLGLPLGAYALAYWTVAPLLGWAKGEWARRLLFWLKGLGAAVALFFLFTQIFLLSGFCLFCALHTVAVVGYALSPGRPLGRLAPLGALVAGVLIISSASEEDAGPGSPVAAEALEGSGKSALLGSEWATRRAIPYYLPFERGRYEVEAADAFAIVSLTCPHCWTYLEGLHANPDRHPYLVLHAGSSKSQWLSSILLKTTAGRVEEADRQRAFVAGMKRFLAQRDRFLKSPERFEADLQEAGLLDGSASAAAASQDWVDAQRRLIGFLGVTHIPRILPMVAGSFQGRPVMGDEEKRFRARLVANNWLLESEGRNQKEPEAHLELVVLDLGKPDCWEVVKTMLGRRDYRPYLAFVSRAGEASRKATLALNLFVHSFGEFSERQEAAYRAFEIWMQSPEAFLESPERYREALLEALSLKEFSKEARVRAESLLQDHNAYAELEGISGTPARLRFGDGAR